MISYFRTNYVWDNVVEPITDDEVREWISDLKSGSFKQTSGSLVDEVGYCCLGVLATKRDLFDKLFSGKDSGTLYSFADKLNHIDSHYFKLPANLQDELATRNDEEVSFEDIANDLEMGFFGNKEEVISILKDRGYDAEEWSFVEGCEDV